MGPHGPPGARGGGPVKHILLIYPPPLLARTAFLIFRRRRPTPTFLLSDFLSLTTLQTVQTYSFRDLKPASGQSALPPQTLLKSAPNRPRRPKNAIQDAYFFASLFRCLFRSIFMRFWVPTCLPKPIKINQKSMPRGHPSWASIFDRFLLRTSISRTFKTIVFLKENLGFLKKWLFEVGMDF